MEGFDFEAFAVLDRWFGEGDDGMGLFLRGQVGSSKVKRCWRETQAANAATLARAWSYLGFRPRSDERRDDAKTNGSPGLGTRLSGMH